MEPYASQPWTKIDLAISMGLIGPGEIWLEHQEYPGYLVGSHGAILSIKGKPRLLNGSFASGYKSVALRRRDGILKMRYVHHVVSEIYKGYRPDPSFDCCHNDGSRTNNNTLNLRWDTKSRNNKDKSIHGTQPRGEDSNLSKLTEADVVRIKALYQDTHIPYKKTAKEFGVTTMTIWNIIKGKSWSHVG